MVASVPEETKRTASIGVRRTISSASSTSGTVGVPYDVPRATASATAACTSGWAWPTSIGPQEQIRSTYSLPSTSVSQAPRAEAMKRGRAADRVERPDRRVHPSRGDRAGPAEELVGPAGGAVVEAVGHGGGHRCILADRAKPMHIGKNIGASGVIQTTSGHDGGVPGLGRRERHG